MSDPTPSHGPRTFRRRTALTAAAGAVLGMTVTGLLAACTAHRTPGPTATRTPSGQATAPLSPAPTPHGPDTWAALMAVLGDRLLRPGAPTWTHAVQLQNPRWDGASPLGIATVESADDVAACITFAQHSQTPVAVRSGGHSYTGWSAGGGAGTDVPASLVISTQNLTTITLSADGERLTVGPGATLISVYRSLAAAGRAIGAGSCPTVGIGGLTLGGGIGVLSRSFGLTSDQLLSVQIVTADGITRTASPTEHADIFWACQGGSGGVIGVVTALTFRTQPAPTITRFTYTFPWTAASAVTQAWQQWAPDADNRLWSTLKLLNGTRYETGPMVTVSGTWTGPSADITAQLLPFLRYVGVAPSTRDVVTADFGSTMDAFAGTTGIPTAACTTGPGGRLSRVPEAATSHIGVQNLDDDAVNTLIRHVERARAVPGLRDGGIAFDALGGAVGAVTASATAFPWRTARYDVQYTAVFDPGADPSPFDAYVREFRAAMRPTWGDTGYSNYVDAAITNPVTYFAGNTQRLRNIARRYAATRLFNQPHWI